MKFWIVLLAPTASPFAITLRFQDQNPSPEPAYYYVRLVQDDRQVAWGSPIWMTYKPWPRRLRFLGIFGSW